MLPAAIIATAARSRVVAALAISAALFLSTNQTVGDVRAAADETADVAYYQSLIDQVDGMQDELSQYRLEVVENGTHTGAFALLNHAMLARGWEYQDDFALNRPITKPTLDATTYKIWLQDNAVGFVAIASGARKPTPEYLLVSEHRPSYLSEVWHDQRWTLYSVTDPNPIVKAPMSVAEHSQSELVLRVPCVCTFTVRVHFSRYLGAQLRPPEPDPSGTTRDRVPAVLEDDGFGWTRMTVTEAGDYVLSGDLTHGLLG